MSCNSTAVSLALCEAFHAFISFCCFTVCVSSQIEHPFGLLTSHPLILLWSMSISVIFTVKCRTPHVSGSYITAQLTLCWTYSATHPWPHFVSLVTTATSSLWLTGVCFCKFLPPDLSRVYLFFLIIHRCLPWLFSFSILFLYLTSIFLTLSSLSTQ